MKKATKGTIKHGPLMLHYKKLVYDEAYAEQFSGRPVSPKAKNEHLLHALHYCNRKGKPLPKWLHTEISALISNVLGIGNPGPTNHAKKMHQFRIDSIRTKAVEDARKNGAKWADAWSLASKALADIHMACGPEAVKKSYQRIQKDRRFYKEVLKEIRREKRGETRANQAADEKSRAEGIKIVGYRLP